MTVAERTPLVEMKDISVAFGGVHAVRDVSIDLYAGEVIGLVGGNGAGKSTLMRVLSGAHPADSGEIRVSGQPVDIRNPRDAKALNIETIYQTLALAGVEVDVHLAHGVHPAERDVDVHHLDERRSLCDGHGSALLVAHEPPRRRFSVSRPTATIRTMPATTFWPGELTPRKLRP